MTEDNDPLRPGPLLSSYSGLHEASIVNGIEFDPIDGLVSVRYGPAYRRILRVGLVRAMDARFVTAVLLDDPREMRRWIEAAAARLDGDEGLEGTDQ